MMTPGLKDVTAATAGILPAAFFRFE